VGAYTEKERKKERTNTELTRSTAPLLREFKHCANQDLATAAAAASQESQSHYHLFG